MMAIVRKQSRKPVKVYTWITCSATSIHLFWCCASPNKDGNARDAISKHMDRTGVPMWMAAEEVFFLIPAFCGLY